jgi:hypothetical protein
VTVALAVSLIGLTILSVAGAQSSTPPPPSNLPIPVSQYGVVTVYSNEAAPPTLGTVKISVVSNGYGAFFVTKLLVFMNNPQQSDLILSTLSIDGFYTLTFSQFSYGSPKVVIIPSGSTMGELVSSLPSYLAPILVKDPLGNMAIVLNGGAGNGLAVSLTFGSQSGGGSVSAEGIVTAPSNNTITITMS